MKNRHARRRVAPALEWLCDITGKTARISAVGGRSLLVENHRGILKFESDEIVLATACGDIHILGQALTLSEARSDALIVRGCIRQVLLPDESDARDER